MIPHTIRHMLDRDEPLIYDCWLQSLADEEGVPRDDKDARRKFKNRRRPQIVEIVARAGTTTLVACARRDATEILGFVCFEKPGILHFVYTAKPWRRGHIARNLVASAGLGPVATATHFTSWGFPHVARFFEKLEFDPTLLVVGT